MNTEQLVNTKRKDKIISFLWNENIIAILLVLISFYVYLITMCRSVGFTDSGELAAVVCTLGIAHPTGYPLFTILGRLWTMIPFPLEEIICLNLFSAFLVAVSVGLFFKTSLALNRSVKIFRSKEFKNDKRKGKYFIFASAIASLTLAFSTTFWSQSNNFEVYSLHLVMLLLVIWTFITGLEKQLSEPNYISSRLVLFAFVLGLSFANHMTTILLAPGFLWLYFYIFKFHKESFLKIFKIIPFYLLGLSVYLYLPVRSASNPLFDWGHPATLERLFWHVSGKQFRVWMFSGWNVVQKQLNYYTSNFTSEFSITAIICIVIGLFILLKRSRRLLIFLILLFAGTIVYAVNYDIFDIGSYFLLSYLAIGWIIAYGAEFFLNWAEVKQRWIRLSVIIGLLIVPAMQIIYNKNNADESKNEIPQKFVNEAFLNLEPNAIIIATQWDYFISPSLYYQSIRKERPDITIIDKSLMQNRTWYFLQLNKYAPWLIERTRAEVAPFLVELNKFEHEIPFNFTIIKACWQDLLNGIVERSLVDRPVYIDARIDQEFPAVYRRIPSGLFLRLTKEEDTTYYKGAKMNFSHWDIKQPAAMDCKQYYIIMLLRDADWLIKHSRDGEAKIVLREVLQMEPANFGANWLLKQIAKME